jgi:hypothetical protein
MAQTVCLLVPAEDRARLAAIVADRNRLLDFQTAIKRYLDEHNADPKPFTWTATPAAIIAKLDQANASRTISRCSSSILPDGR